MNTPYEFELIETLENKYNFNYFMLFPVFSR